MRQFVVVGHDAPTTPDDVSLSDLPGAGRLDLLCRCVATGVFLSHGIRESVRVHLVHDDALTVTFDADRLRHLHPDERNVAARIRDALAAREDAIGHMPADVSPGVELRRMGLAATLDRVAAAGTLVELHEDGEPLVDAAPPVDPVFVLSDHHDFTDAEADLLAEHAERRVRVGPELLHADHTISVAHNWLDTDGYASY
ncbi:tRNA (pseudouridine(54)-N(1))-methyltransferase TrmY [Halorubrum sp. JWXQ-INN 858]|uniref:tRNA (pseudouridine(54)-N(1))-methyltransferase TrmY n=1 Tax=Halorubrum sp. JWXQ-INN 858 TaxID=2690782 RepID=UPI00135B1E0D|nr:tRNA (pseudouridine(54)-N(1))-methyltransferase TrmY [Halorubrum sp. JWXQ-INN 858]MWV63293.1 tRNA (pseudouridine(54)-N(1))-methyltransferase TrmY [Halorubrum sp. JWXQ-INN 858]